MKRLMVAVGLAVILLFGLSNSFAQTPGHGGEHGSMARQEHGYGSGRGAMHHGEAMGGKELSMTPEQKAAFRELKRKFKLENAQLIGSLVAKKIELMALWTDPKADPKAIMEKEKEFRSIKFQLGEKAVQYKLEARKSLTPEQIAKFGARWGRDHGFGHHHKRGHEGMKRGKGMMGGGMKGCCGMMEQGRGMGMKGHSMSQGMGQGMGQGMAGMGMCK